MTDEKEIDAEFDAKLAAAKTDLAKVLAPQVADASKYLARIVELNEQVLAGLKDGTIRVRDV